MNIAFLRCVVLLCACFAVAVAVPRATGQDTEKPEPKSIFDDNDADTPAPPRTKREADPVKTSPTEPTDPPATEAPREQPPVETPKPAPPALPKSAPTPAAPMLLPIPAQAEQDKALKLVKEVYADDFRKKVAADRIALAGRLMEQAADAGNDAATKYVMLREARDLAAAGGDIPTALSAVDAMTETFAVNAVQLKMEVLTAVAKKPADAAAAAAVAEGFAELAEEALADADIDRANKMITQAEAVAKKAKDDDLSAKMTRRKKELREFVAQFGPLAPLKDKLKKNPDDPAANLALGKFYCFAAGDWNRGLPMLARGSDAALQKLARADLAGADKPEAQAGIGDGWFDFSEKPNAAGKSQLRARAGYWYEQSLPSLSGLQRTRVEKRMAGIEADGATTAAGGSSTPADKGMRMLEAIVAKIPAESRPRTGKAMDTYRVGRLLTGQLFKAQFDAELAMSHIETMSFLGRESVYASFQTFGPLSLDGADYTLRIIIDTRKQKSPEDMAKLTPGTRVRVRAIIKDVDALRYYDSDRNVTNHYQIRLTLANPTLTLIAAPSAGRTSTRNGGGTSGNTNASAD